MAPLAARLIWLAWGGVLVMEGGSWLLYAPSQMAMVVLRSAELLWLSGVIYYSEQASVLGISAPTRGQWWLLLQVAIGCGLIAGLLAWQGLLAPWLLLPPFVHGAGGVLLLLLLAPLVEELLFRGLLYRMLEELVGMWPAIVGSGVCFALAHGALLSPQLLGGLLFAWLYARSGNLWLPIMLHAAANAALLLLCGGR